MTTNPNLIPEPRTNKNGVTSVKWVLPSTGDNGSAAAGIPLVKMSATVAARTEHLLAIGDKLADSLNMKPEHVVVLQRNLSFCSPATLESISHACGRSKRSDEAIWQVGITTSGDEQAISDFIELLPVIEKDTSLDLADAVMFVDNMAGYEFLPEASQERKEQVEALFIAAVAIHSDVKVNPANHVRYTAGHSDELYSVEDNLAQLVAERPERVHDILDIIRERKTADAETIREFLDPDVPALGGGFL